MQNFFQNKIVVVGLISLAVAGAAWYGLTSSPPTDTLVTTGAVVNAPGADLVETLLALRAVKLDGAIFSEPAFAALVDFSTPIIPEPVGRPNPFAPLTVALSTTTNQQAAIFAPQHGQAASAAGARSRQR